MNKQMSSVTANWALDRYEAIRPRMPDAIFPNQSIVAANLGEIADEFDAFVFDSFGVLNVGDSPIHGACERIVNLRSKNKKVAILTNAATVPLAKLQQKYSDLGFAFDDKEIISSREVLALALRNQEAGKCWGVAAPASANVIELPANCHLLSDTDASFETYDGFILLSGDEWSSSMQGRLIQALQKHPRSLLVGNPDLVAPRVDGLSMEPGAYAHEIADRTGVTPEFFGKPFQNAFVEVTSRLGHGTEHRRIAMIGDSLHTDILGGAAAGWRTVLVTEHGLMKDLDVNASIEATGITPDFIIPSI